MGQVQSSRAEKNNPSTFSTGFKMESKEYFWEIRNFAWLGEMESSLNKMSIKFEMGHEIGLPSILKTFVKINDDKFGIFIKLIPNDPEVRNTTTVYGNCSIQVLKRNGATFYKRELEAPDVLVEGGQLNRMGFAEISTGPEMEKNSPALLSKDGHLKIRIKVNIMLPETHTVGDHLQNVRLAEIRQDSRKGVVEGLKFIRKDNLFTDATIKTRDGKVFPLHKALLSGQSKVFLAMFATKMSEADKGLVVIEDMDGPAFETVLDFIYTGKLNKNWYKRDDFVQIISAAKKYDLQVLFAFCDETLHSRCKGENGLDLLAVAKLYNMQIAAGRIQEFIKKNPLSG